MKNNCFLDPIFHVESISGTFRSNFRRGSNYWGNLDAHEAQNRTYNFTKIYENHPKSTCLTQESWNFYWKLPKMLYSCIFDITKVSDTTDNAISFSSCFSLWPIANMCHFGNSSEEMGKIEQNFRKMSWESQKINILKRNVRWESQRTVVIGSVTQKDVYTWFPHFWWTFRQGVLHEKKVQKLVEKDEIFEKTTKNAEKIKNFKNNFSGTKVTPRSVKQPTISEIFKIMEKWETKKKHNWCSADCTDRH